MTSAPPNTPPAAASTDAPPTVGAIFLAFSGIAILGFGGVLPWARRALVEKRRWLSADEFTEVLSLGQFLPGGNIINVAVVVGERFRGPFGSLAAVVGLLAAPTAIVIALGSLYLAYGQRGRVHDALAGATAAAAGLILATAWKMAEPLLRRRAPAALAMVALTFVAVGILKLPLLLVLAVMVPVGVALAGRGVA